MPCDRLLLERSRCGKCSAYAGRSNQWKKCRPGTIRGDYSMSVQENIVHASDSPETAAIELKKIFSMRMNYLVMRQKPAQSFMRTMNSER